MKTLHVKCSKASRGFTLIEVIIATSMTVALVIAVSAYFGVVSKLSVERRGSQMVATNLGTVREKILSDVRAASNIRVVRYGPPSNITGSTIYSSVLILQLKEYSDSGAYTGREFFRTYCAKPQKKEIDGSWYNRIVQVDSNTPPLNDKSVTTGPVVLFDYTSTPLTKNPCGYNDGLPVNFSYIPGGVFMTDDTTSTESLYALPIVRGGVVEGVRVVLKGWYDPSIYDQTITIPESEKKLSFVTLVGMGKKNTVDF